MAKQESNKGEMKKHRFRTKPEEVPFPVDSNYILFPMPTFVNSYYVDN